MGIWFNQLIWRNAKTQEVNWVEIEESNQVLVSNWKRVVEKEEVWLERSVKAFSTKEEVQNPPPLGSSAWFSSKPGIWTPCQLGRAGKIPTSAKDPPSSLGSQSGLVTCSPRGHRKFLFSSFSDERIEGFGFAYKDSFALILTILIDALVHVILKCLDQASFLLKRKTTGWHFIHWHFKYSADALRL